MRRPAVMTNIVGVLLAGGGSRRMGGGDKCLKLLGGRPILDHVIERAGGQVDRLVLNANGDPSRFAQYGLPVAPDVLPGGQGPLAGVLTGMLWARQHAPDALWLATFPTDAPFLPTDLVSRMIDTLCDDGTRLACAASDDRTHPVVGLWPIALAEELADALEREGLRKIDIWTARYPLSHVIWPTDPIDPFLNVNRPEDLARAEHALAQERVG